MTEVVTCWCGGRATVSDTMPAGWACLESVWHDPTSDGIKKDIKTLYIAGPMSGLPMNNYPLFNEIATVLRRCGYAVVNPAEFGATEGASYVDLLRKDLRALLDCDGVCVLDNWWTSVGARNEVQVAGVLKMPVHPTREWIEMKGTER